MSLSRCLSRLALVTALFSAHTAFADALSDLASSEEMRKFKSRARVDNLLGPKYMDPKSNFASAFIPGDGYVNLQTWIAPAEGGFRGGTIHGKRMDEYVDSRRVFKSESVGEILVRILVPHPKFVEMLKYQLVRPFNEIEPPALDYANKESIEIHGTRADLYVHKDGGCSLIMHVARSSVVQLLQQDCTGLHNLVTLAELLDTKRLDRKLDS